MRLPALLCRLLARLLRRRRGDAYLSALRAGARIPVPTGPAPFSPPTGAAPRRFSKRPVPMAPRSG